MKCGVVGWVKGWWEWLGDNPNTQRVLVMVTGAILISGLLQWYVMRQTLHVTERPYILFEGATMTPNISVGGKPTFQAGFKNEGRTPAFIMDEQITFRVYDHGLPIKPQYDRLPSEQPQNAALPPSGAINFRAIWPDKLPLTKELVDDLEHGKKELYIFGFVTYDDAFPVHHVSGFCLKYLPSDETLVARLQGCEQAAYTYYK